MSPRRAGGCLGDALSGPPRRPVGSSSGAPQPSPAAAAWRSRAPAAAPSRRRGRRAPPGEDEGRGGRPLHDQLVGAAGPEPLGPWDGAEEPHGAVDHQLKTYTRAGDPLHSSAQVPNFQESAQWRSKEKSLQRCGTGSFSGLSSPLCLSMVLQEC
ncbi:transmembrane protein 170B isoform X1 [Choloepus didactylus]|uniref:transmembrane protein 170B isoform X1 n=1 Tax=Choloepus didactylus TaxID=27675 RepID=UPI00189FCF3A|nr:transmembrane protein 170B isoform X1 [Choloepus didactylus]